MPSRLDRPHATTTRADWIALGVILAVAVVLRLLYLSEIRGQALFSALTADPAIYEAQARDILRGILVPDHAYFHSSPLYPFFLAAVMKLAGPGFQTVRLIQAGVGCASVLLIYLLSRLTVGARPALVSAAFAAVYVPLIFFEAEFLEITLVIAFTAGALVMLERADTRLGGRGDARRGGGRSSRRSREARGRGLQDGRALWWAAGSGALLGLASLGKPNLLLVAPVGAMWLAAQPRGGRSAPRPRAWTSSGWRRRAPAAALFFVVCGLTILPATVHNYRTDGDLIPVSSNAGINLFIGNHPGAPGTFTVPAEMRFDLRVASKEAAQAATGRSMSAGEVSDYWTSRALAFMRHRPAMWLAQTATKFALFWNHYEIPNHYDLSFVARTAPVLRLPLGTFAVVAPLGVVGLVLASLRRKNVGLLVLFGVTFMCSVVPFFITARYRLPIVLALLPGAGYAVHEFVRSLRSRSWRAAVAVAAPVAAAAFLVNVDMLEFNPSQMHNTVGAILAGRGDMESAATEFEAAVEANALDVSARRNLGLVYLELDRYREATRELRRAVEIHPGYADAWLELGQAYAGLDSLDAARNAWSKVLSMRAPPELVAEARRLLEETASYSGNETAPPADADMGETR